MRFNVLTDSLLRGIKTVERAVSQRSSLPVLANILMETDDGRIKLAATDLEMGIVCWVPADVEEAGSITVPARLLSEFVGQLEGKEIQVQLHQRTMMLELFCGKYLANIKGMDGREFPIVPAGPGDGKIEVGALALAEAIKGVVLAAATDESRPTLTGVYMVIHGEGMTMATTDGFRLAVRGVALKASAGREKVELLVPATSLREVARIVEMQKDWDESVYVEVCPVGTQQVRFHMPGVDVTSQVIDANFPNYRGIIPKSTGTRVLVDRKSLERSLRMALLFARDSVNIVRFKIEPASEGKDAYVELSATSAEMGDNSGKMDAEVEGDALEIAFNGRYMLEAVSATDAVRVKIEMTRASAPCVIKPEHDHDTREVLYVVMPMHVTK